MADNWQKRRGGVATPPTGGTRVWGAGFKLGNAFIFKKRFFVNPIGGEQKVFTKIVTN